MVLAFVATVTLFALLGSWIQQTAGTMSIVGILLGLIIGGELANRVEIVIRNAVTDYVGIQPLGIVLSAGDLFLSVGFALVPITFARFADGPVARVLVGGAVYLALVSLGLIRSDSVVPALATALTGLGLAVWIAKRVTVRGRTRPSASAGKEP